MSAGADDDTGDAGFDPTKYDFDPRPADYTDETPQERVAVIRTSDRILFKKCRRRWGWNSHLRGNIGPKQNAAPLWYGSGFHFALEDYHGDKLFPSASAAFLAYVEATKKFNRKSLPSEVDELTELGVGMLDYYTNHWMAGRDVFKTFYFDGKPQVEVNFRIEIPWEEGRFGYDRVVYSGTLDRVAIDEHGRLWIVEYKTAKAIQTLHLSNDSQCTAYVWAGNHLYPGYDIAGVVYQQHRKELPQEPKILASGKVSTDRRMLTTHRAYRQSLLNIYGSIKQAPQVNVDFLNHLDTLEDLDGDKFVKRTRVHRNANQAASEGVKILLELEDMLNPDLGLYPNPTRDCAFMCPFLGMCVSLDDGSDWEYERDILMEPRAASYDKWRDYLEIPNG